MPNLAIDTNRDIAKQSTKMNNVDLLTTATKAEKAKLASAMTDKANMQKAMLLAVHSTASKNVHSASAPVLTKPMVAVEDVNGDEIVASLANVNALGNDEDLARLIQSYMEDPSKLEAYANRYNLADPAQFAHYSRLTVNALSAQKDQVANEDSANKKEAKSGDSFSTDGFKFFVAMLLMWVDFQISKEKSMAKVSASFTVVSYELKKSEANRIITAAATEFIGTASSAAGGAAVTMVGSVVGMAGTSKQSTANDLQKLHDTKALAFEERSGITKQIHEHPSYANLPGTHEEKVRTIEEKLSRIKTANERHKQKIEEVNNHADAVSIERDKDTLKANRKDLLARMERRRERGIEIDEREQNIEKEHLQNIQGKLEELELPKTEIDQGRDAEINATGLTENQGKELDLLFEKKQAAQAKLEEAVTAHKDQVSNPEEIAHAHETNAYTLKTDEYKIKDMHTGVARLTTLSQTAMNLSHLSQISDGMAKKMAASDNALRTEEAAQSNIQAELGQRIADTHRNATSQRQAVNSLIDGEKESYLDKQKAVSGNIRA